MSSLFSFCLMLTCLDYKTNLELPMTTLTPIIKRMTEAPIPLLMWMGYSSTLSLVSAWHVESWTAFISKDPVTRVFPRRWIDITGSRITEVWEAALRAVMGVIVFRPGIIQASRVVSLCSPATDDILHTTRLSYVGAFDQSTTDKRSMTSFDTYTRRI